MNIAAPQFLDPTYLGPMVPIGITRKYLPYSLGAAPAYIPSALFSTTIYPLSAPVEKLAFSPEVTLELLTNLKDDFKNHLEMRLQLFFQQLMLVYKTQLVFHLYTHADIQIGQGKAPYTGAHSGTLPTLRIASEEQEDASISFAQNTSFYYEWNTTTYLPEVANQLDSLIDKLKQHNTNLCLREIATNLLNKAASNSITPQEGLHAFSKAIIETLETIKQNNSSEQRAIILDSYIQIATNYFENIDNGYPLIQKLCLQPLTATIDDDFYTQVQAEMHQRLKKEIFDLEPDEIIIAPPLPEDFDSLSLQEALFQKLPFDPISRTIKEYVRVCTLSKNVIASAMYYFVYLHSLAPEKRTADLDLFSKIALSTTIQNINLSYHAKSLYEEVLKTIRNQANIQEPKNMNLILLSLLKSISRDHLPKQPDLLEAPTANAKETLKTQIESKIKEANLKQTDQARQYVNLCIQSDKVNQKAQELIQKLLLWPKAMQDSEIDRWLKIIKAKIGSSGLCQETTLFYKAVLEEIEQRKKVKSPRRMPLILSQILLSKLS